MHKKKRIHPIFIILPIVIILLALVSFPIAKVSITKNQASSLKDSLSYFLECVKSKDSDGAEKALADAYEKTDILNDSLNGGFWKTARKVPFIDKELDVADNLMDVVCDVEDDLLTPLVDKMKEYPLTDLKVGDGFNTNLMNVYLDFLEEKQPFLEEVLTKIDSIDTESLIGNFLGEKKDSIYEIVDSYHEASSLLPLIRVLIGNGEDRLYLLVAQNSAEIRASGGFPGSIGTIRIKDGVMSIGDFKSVYDVLSNFSSNNSDIGDEDYIFGTWIDAPRDACFIPDFKKVGQIWAVGYQDYKVDHPDEDEFSEEEDYYDYEEDYDYWYEDPVEDYDEVGAEKIFSNITVNRRVFVGDPADEGGEVPPDDGGDGGEGEDPGNEGENPDDNTDDDPDADPDDPNKPDDEKKKDGKTEEEAFPVGYRIYHDESEYAPYHVDGVISLTPSIIQMLMEDIGEIELSDGTKLNGNNATRILQHELYYKYFNSSTDINAGNTMSDQLFSETAKTVMKDFVANFEISKFADYYKLFKTGIEKNVIRIWMADENEEKIIEEAGVSGKLNDDPENPVAGVYFSLADPSKLGWYLDILPEISEPVINEDNSRTYDVSITLKNILSDEEFNHGTEYVIGSYNGSIRAFIHCFAPAGGTITDVETSNGMYMLEDIYHDLQVAYNLDVVIERGEPIEITYKITTAPGVETPLKVVTTPTLTEYRLPEDYGTIAGYEEWDDEESWY